MRSKLFWLPYVPMEAVRLCDEWIVHMRVCFNASGCEGQVAVAPSVARDDRDPVTLPYTL